MPVSIATAKHRIILLGNDVDWLQATAHGLAVSGFDRVETGPINESGADIRQQPDDSVFVFDDDDTARCLRSINGLRKRRHDRPDERVFLYRRGGFTLKRVRECLDAGVDGWIPGNGGNGTGLALNLDHLLDGCPGRVSGDREISLRKSLDSLFGALGDPIVIANDANVVVWANGAASELLGFSPDELCGRSFLVDLLRVGPSGEIRKGDEGGVLNFERTELVLEGHRLIRVLLSDCSKDNRREPWEAAALDGAGVGLWLWDIESGCVSLRGHAASWFAAETGVDEIFFDDWPDAIRSDDRQHFLEQLAESIDGHRPFSVNVELVRRSGEDVRTRLLLNGSPTIDDEGQVVSLSGSVVAASEAILPPVNGAVRSHESSGLLEHAQDAVMILGIDGGVRFWNRGATRLYGKTADSVVDRSFVQVTHADPVEFEKALLTVMADGEWSGELNHDTDEGGTIVVLARLSLVRDENGLPAAVFAICTDYTEKKLLESQFFRAQRLESIGTLAGGIAHDLNNVLAPILMAVDYLKLKPIDEGTSNMVHVVEKSARRAADMVTQVLSFARGFEGKHMTVQPLHLLKEMQKIAAETFPKSISATVRCEGKINLISGDPTQLHQVLLNLCVNARDAMPDGGKLVLETRNVELDSNFASMDEGARPGAYVLISVKDTGCGIPAETLKRIFDPFFTTKEMGKGTGLGLATVRSIVHNHRGFLRVNSLLGKGTCFDLYLPVSERGEVPAEPAEPVTLVRGNNRLILVVDDEPSIREITRQTLETFGYRTIVAADGTEAVALYAQHIDDIDIVITDMMMPLMDGTDTIHALKRMNPAARIIAASGLPAESHAAKAAVAGVYTFLAKPFTAEKLLRTIQDILSNEAANCP